MIAGGTQTVKVVMINNGTTTWTIDDYVLKVMPPSPSNPNGPLVWGIRNAALSDGQPVPPGGKGKFNFTITAPSTSGTYSFSSQMKNKKGSKDVFGSVSPVVNIVVGPSTGAPHVGLNAVAGTEGAIEGNNATYTSQLVGATMTAGDFQVVQVTLTNSGTTTWTADGSYALDVLSNTWTTVSVPIDEPVAPGASVTFTFVAEAPIPVDGLVHSYPLQCQMNGWTAGYFGDVTPVVNIEVEPVASVAQNTRLRAQWPGGTDQRPPGSGGESGYGEIAGNRSGGSEFPTFLRTVAQGSVLELVTLLLAMALGGMLLTDGGWGVAAMRRALRRGAAWVKRGLGDPRRAMGGWTGLALRAVGWINRFFSPNCRATAPVARVSVPPRQPGRSSYNRQNRERAAFISAFRSGHESFDQKTIRSNIPINRPRRAPG